MGVLQDQGDNPVHGTDMFPLCVDLDGTIANTDTFFECLAAAMHKWSILRRISLFAFKGKARIKEELACRVKFDPVLLPYNSSLLQYLHKQRSRNRKLVLVTAANERIAEAVNSHLGIFDEVIASSAARNLRGAEKAKILVERFGARKFSYAGNGHTDLHVWKYAYSGVLVNTTNRTAAQAVDLTMIEQRFDTDKPHRMKALLRSLRPHQWVKNLLVFVPLITANAFGDLDAIINAFILFVAFCITSSGVYIMNDLFDLEADRRHPTKRERPFASGRVSIATGFAMVPILLVAGLLVSLSTRAPAAVALLLVYLICTILYSMKLKEFPLVDVFTLSALYSIRLFAGGEVTRYRVSFWLLAFSGFIFLALAIIKRTAELKTMTTKKGQVARRGYSSEDQNVIQIFGIASSFVSSVVLALYIHSRAAADIYSYPEVLWLLVPVILFWECRLWLSTSRGYMDDDPIVYSAKDWVSWIVGLIVAVIIFSARAKD